MAATSGILLLSMAGVKLAVMSTLMAEGRHRAGQHLTMEPRHRYDHSALTLYLDAGLTLAEVSNICDSVLELVVSRSLEENLDRLGLGPA